MKRLGSWGLCLVAIIELLVIPILEVVAYVFSIISTFEYAESFRTKPEYKYYTPIVSSTRDVTNESCEIKWTKELVDYINGMEVGYIYTLFVFSIIFNTLSLLMNNVTRIFKYFAGPQSPKLFWCKVASAVITYLALVFSVPALYATKMKYGRCLTVEGIMSGYINSNAYFVINAGMWSSIALPLGYLVGICQRCNGDIATKCKCLILILGVGYIIFAFISKYCSFVFLQFGWDLCLNFEILLPIFKLCCGARNKIGLLA